MFKGVSMSPAESAARVIDVLEFIMLVAGVICIGFGVYDFTEGGSGKRTLVGVAIGLVLIAAAIVLFAYAPSILKAGLP